MGYYEIASMGQDQNLQQREAACIAQEDPAQDPYSWAAMNALRLAAQPGWGEAWASALAAGNASPGKDPAVITDGMILSAVQAIVAAEF